jgi:2,4-dienoyl-CoA reductase-like NADH-dependent reductase (Old Yellow Enzyme family)
MIKYNQLEACGNIIIPRTGEFSGECLEAFREFAQAAKKHGSLIIVLVSHPGRQVESRPRKIL